jgi:drug/metabolite transporter (DMT)-like permease
VRPSNVAVLIALSIIWGSAFALVKVVLEEVEPLTLVAGRLAGAALFLSLALLVRRRRLPLTRRALTAFALLGVINNVFPFVMLSWGQQHIESSLAAILTASMPLSTVLLAHLWIGERLTLDRTLGILVGFGGVFLLIGGDLRDITESSTLGQLAIIAGVLGYSFGIVFGRRYLQTADTTATAVGQTLVGALVMVPVALGADRPFDLSISLKVGLAWATLSVLASGVAYLLYFPLVRDVTAAQASMVGYLIPITAVFVGAFFLDERLAASSFVGLALIIAGVSIVNGGALWLAARVRRPAARRAGPVRGGGGGDTRR